MRVDRRLVFEYPVRPLARRDDFVLANQRGLLADMGTSGPILSLLCLHIVGDEPAFRLERNRFENAVGAGHGGGHIRSVSHRAGVLQLRYCRDCCDHLLPAPHGGVRRGRRAPLRFRGSRGQLHDPQFSAIHENEFDAQRHSPGGLGGGNLLLSLSFRTAASGIGAGVFRLERARVEAVCRRSWQSRASCSA